jgi:CheY-like chemotaxis protein
LELLQRGLGNAETKVTRRIDAAMDGAKRAAALTHRLLAFARRQPLEPAVVEANRLVAGMADMLSRVLGEHIALEFVHGAGLWRVLADVNQLENSILNLAVNARDAMPAGGHLTIETQNVYLDEDYTQTRPDIEPGQYVMIAVTDTGTGMTQDVVGKVFEPFFTTKPQGQGTGLGLAQVYGFIRQSQGHVSIYSEPGQGTSVKLYLPRVTSGAAGERADAGPVAAATVGRGEMILVVEDEENVRNFSVEVLEELGYQVVAVENASSALDALETLPRVDLLFTDVVLTGTMNGRVLADEVMRRRPGTAVLFTTGYTRNAIVHHGRLDEGIDFLGKPFTASALTQMVRRLLDRAKMGAAIKAG